MTSAVKVQTSFVLTTVTGKIGESEKSISKVGRFGGVVGGERGSKNGLQTRTFAGEGTLRRTVTFDEGGGESTSGLMKLMLANNFLADCWAIRMLERRGGVAFDESIF